MTICFFGTYNPHYGRTSTLREGLRRLGVTVREVNVEIPNIRMELPEDYTLKTTLFRIWRKLKAYGTLLFRFSEVASCDCIVVLHPGHLDIPLAWVFAKLSGKRLLFDDGLSPYDTMFVGRSIAERSSLKARLVKFVESFFLSLTDKVFVDTDRMGMFLHKELGVPKQKIFSVLLGANDVLYTPSQTKRKNKTVDVLFFGLYNPMHGAPTILEAAKKLQKEAIHFTMLGDGYLKDDLIAYARKNRLTHVEFTGFIPEADLVKRIQAADIVLGVFSKSPVFERVIPNKVFGALACKKALITVNTPAVSEYMNNGVHALLCPPEDATALARAIETLATSAKKRDTIAQNGYELYKKTATPTVLAKAFLQQGLGVNL